MTGVDETARVEQFIRHRPQLMAYAQSLVSNPEDAADLLQDVSLAVLLRRDAPVDSDHFLHWCCAAAHHLALHHWRARDQRQELFESSSENVEDADLPISASLEQELVDRDSIESCLRPLDRGARRLLLLRYGAGKTTEEIARNLGESPAAVRTKILRARDSFCGHFRRSEMTRPG